MMEPLKICAVCGYDELEDPPYDEYGCCTYEICPCCGYQYSVTDTDRGIGFEQYAKEWIEKGFPLFSERFSERARESWNAAVLRAQLRNIAKVGHYKAYFPSSLSRAGWLIKFLEKKRRVEFSTQLKLSNSRFFALTYVEEVKELPICPVCGYDKLDEPPYDKEGCCSYETCACCGYQYGFTDGNRYMAFREYAEKWIEKGFPFYSEKDKPKNWNAEVLAIQLKNMAKVGYEPVLPSAWQRAGWLIRLLDSRTNRVFSDWCVDLP